MATANSKTPENSGAAASCSEPAAAKDACICFIVAPEGAAGGGMGRVKDYLLQADTGGSLVFRSLVTRNGRGVLYSALLTLRAVALIWFARVTGRLALVHVNMGDSASALRKGIVVVMARLVGAKVVLHLHAVSLDRHYRFGSWLLRALVRIPFRVASTNIVLGEIWRRWLIDELGVAESRVDVVLNGVPVSARRRRSFGSDHRPVRLLFLGNLTERKGISDLLSALSMLPAETPEWHLIVAGGGDVDRYREVGRKLDISDRLEFLGWVDQKKAQELIVTADVLVLPSYEEGLPLVILEALGHGTPVICAPVGAIPEVLEDRRTALFCRSGDVAGLSLRIAELIARPSLRQSLSNEGLAAYNSHFTLLAFTSAILDVYRRRCDVDCISKNMPSRTKE